MTKDYKDVCNHRDMIRVEKNAQLIKIKFFQSMFDKINKTNFEALTQLQTEQTEIVKATMNRYKQCKHASL